MILWADGFDHYVSDAQMLNGAYAEAGGYDGPSTAQKRTGTKGYLLNGLAQGFRKVVGNAKQQLGIGFAIYPRALPVSNSSSTSMAICLMSDFNNVNQVHLRVATTGHLQVYRSTGGVLIAQSADPVIVANAFQHIEWYVEFDQVAGVVKVRVNNIEVINVTGVDTCSTALAEASNVKFTTANTDNGGLAYYIDDFYIYDTAGDINNAYPIGDMQLLPIYPSADTAEADFTKSTGTDGSALLRDTSDATFVQSAAVGDMSEYELQDVAENVNFIAGVFLHSRLSKSDAGVAQMKVGLVSGAAVASGADRPITVTPTYWSDSIEKNPATGERWTRTALNAAKLRIERTL